MRRPRIKLQSLLITIFLFYSANASLCRHLMNTPYSALNFLDRGQGGDKLSICSNEANSCCTSKMESAMRKTAEETMKTSVEESILVLKQMLVGQVDKFTLYLHGSLTTCHSQLDHLFKQTYGPFYEHNSKLFENFFSHLRGSISNGGLDVDSAVEKMFENLYRVVFSLLNPMSQISSTQWRCMQESMEEIQPFGDVPKKITAHLRKSLQTWRDFLSITADTQHILSGFLNVSVSRECASAVTRLSECSLCSAKPSKPCKGFCVNVYRGCLADWAEIDQQWEPLVGALIGLADKLKTTHNLQDVLGPLPVQISEAVMIFQDKGASITNKVLAKCFPIDDVLSSEERRAIDDGRRYRLKRSIQMRHLVQQTQSNSRVVTALINDFKDKLISAKSFFSSLPSSICDEISSDSDTVCWNGIHTAGYDKPTAGLGLAHQRTNPEFQGALLLPYRGLFIDERLHLGMMSVRAHVLLRGRSSSSASYDLEEGSSSFLLPDDEDMEGSSLEDISIINLDPSIDPIDSASILEHNIATNALEHSLKSSRTLSSYSTFLLLSMLILLR